MERFPRPFKAWVIYYFDKAYKPKIGYSSFPRHAGRMLPATIYPQMVHRQIFNMCQVSLLVWLLEYAQMRLFSCHL